MQYFPAATKAVTENFTIGHSISHSSLGCSAFHNNRVEIALHLQFLVTAIRTIRPLFW